MGNVWRHSRRPEGCRIVQAALDAAATDDERDVIATELRGHVVEAAKCMNANHVLQKIIVMSSAHTSQFVIDELLELGRAVGKVARHKYSCRVLQRLLEHCQPSQIQPLVDRLVADGPALSAHTYGTYVVRCILEHGTPAQRHRIATMLVSHVGRLGADANGAAVLSAAMSHCSADDRAALSEALAIRPDLMVRMSCTRFGHPAVVKVLEVLGDAEGAEAREALAASRASLQACRYGKVVAAKLGGA